jgi:hypothetical protein
LADLIAIIETPFVLLDAVVFMAATPLRCKPLGGRSERRFRSRPV